ncbi:FtsX-like permease family protein [soil metagenome]
MIWLWLTGLLRRRPVRLMAVTTGVAVTVAMLATLGAFLAQSRATMTDRAVRNVAVDWQIQLTPGADPAAVQKLVDTSPHITTAVPVGYAQTTGLSSTSGASTQTTGPGVVLGVPEDYATLFPGEIRTLVGAKTGVLLAQQTASNLHAGVGDTIVVGRQGFPAATLTVAGVVDLPQSNSLFQKVGAPPGAQPVAPPDNVVLLPKTQWHRIFDPVAAARPDLVTSQIHVRLDHTLPRDPAGAYTDVTTAAHNFEARSVGRALVGDNLGATLDAARSDAAYARVLFVFLGLPGTVLAAVLTATVASAGSLRRTAEQALLRARGTSARQLLALAGVEAVFIGVAGAVLGILAAAAIGRFAFGAAGFGGSLARAIGWPVGAAVAGMAIAAATVVLPARRDLREHTVASGRAVIGTLAYPRWARYGLDLLVLVAAGVVFRTTSGSGYQVVLAPEGVATISVSYWAFVGPALLWCGAALLTWRIADLILGAGQPMLTRALRPVTGRLAGTVAAMLSRQRRPLVRAITLFCLAIAFAVSTATFNATYRQQAEVDAQLTNGADVTATLSPGAPPAPATAISLAAIPGVRAVEPIQHRFAYVGADLQDLYGVNPATISTATALQDAYFPGATAAGLMHTLAAKPDSILVSAETVHDFQLQLGDPITLRLVDGLTHQQKPVVFHYAGVVTEFPTAPKDSFFVADAGYVAAQTGSNEVGAYLIDTGGGDTAAVAAHVRDLLGTGATVTDIATVRSTVGSSLTSVDLAGLTRIELSFAIVLAAAAGGLVLGLGFAERRRSYAILTALGARRKHLRALIFSESGIFTVIGLLTGALTGAVLSEVLIKVLAGVFDPPPAAVAVPWFYLGVMAGVSVSALLAVSVATVSIARRPAIPVLREA